MTKQEITELLDKYMKIPIDFSYNHKIFQSSCSEITKILKEHEGDQNFINNLLEINYDKELSDISDILMYVSKNGRHAGNKILYDFCLEKIQNNKDDSDTILKNIKILHQADIDYTEIILDYGYFIKDVYKKTYTHILDKIMPYLSFKKWNIDENELGTYYINGLIEDNGGRSATKEKNSKIVTAIKTYKHSMFDLYKKSISSYNKNMVLECLKENNYNILISLISEHKRTRSVAPDTSYYLAIYANSMYKKDKPVNDKIFLFLLKNAKMESLFEFRKIQEEYHSFIDKNFYMPSDKINILYIMNNRYTSPYKKLIERLVEEKQLNRMIKINKKNENNKEILLGEFLKTWTLKYPEVYHYIEKWQIAESLQEVNPSINSNTRRRL